MPVLDTTFLVDLIRRKNEALILLAQLEESEALCTTVINALELYKGAYLSVKPPENENKVRRVLRSLTILTIDEAVYSIFGTLSSSLKASGQQIGDLDTIIASIVLSYDGKIVTRDTHFNQVEGIEVITY